MHTRMGLCAALLLTACNGDKDAGETGTVDECPAEMVFTDVNNYSYTVDLQLTSVNVGAEEDATIDWSAMTTDFRQRALAPSDVSKVTVARFSLTHDEVVAGVNSNGIDQADIQNYISYTPAAGETSQPLTSFIVEGLDLPFNPADTTPTGLNEDAASSYVLSLWRKNDLGNDEIVMSMFIVPTTGEANHTVAVTDTSATLTASADLHSLTPLCAPAGAATYGLDYSGLQKDANGHDYDLLTGDLLRISHLPQDSITDVEAVFLQLDTAATETYYGYRTVGVGASPYGQLELTDLSKAETVDGTPFPGFTTDGTWLVDVECTSLGCFSPAPLFLGVVEVK